MCSKSVNQKLCPDLFAVRSNFIDVYTFLEVEDFLTKPRDTNTSGRDSVLIWFTPHSSETEAPQNWCFVWNQSALFMETETPFDPFCVLVRAEQLAAAVASKIINGVRALWFCAAYLHRGRCERESESERDRARTWQERACTLYVKHLFKSFP